jgi:hypothetical protein
MQQLRTYTPSNLYAHFRRSLALGKKETLRSGVIHRLMSIVAPIVVATKTDNLPHVVYASCDAEVFAGGRSASPRIASSIIHMKASGCRHRLNPAEFLHKPAISV